MNDGRQSDRLIVPKKRANKDGAAWSAERSPPRLGLLKIL